MPRIKKPWFRVYGEMVRDRKLARLSPSQRWVWVVMMCCASESPMRGWLMLSEQAPCTDKDLARESGVPLKTVQHALREMQSLGMIERAGDTGAWFIPSWWDRQFESDSQPHRARGGDD